MLVAICIFSLSIALQFTAAYLAFRLIRTTGWQAAWSCITIALLLMGIRRSISFIQLLQSQQATINLSTELVALTISALMLVGAALIEPIFKLQQRVKTELKESEEKYRGLFNGSEVPMLSVDLSYAFKRLNELREKGVEDLRVYLYQNPNELQVLFNNTKITHANRASIKLFAANSETQLVKNILNLLNNSVKRLFVDQLCAIWKAKPSYRTEVSLSTLAGRKVTCVISMQVPTAEVSFGNVPFVILNITERKKAEETIWIQANFDDLTGLPNRRMMRDRLHQEIANAKRTGHPITVILLDLDGFKEVNDTLGHAIGDQLLRSCANRLLSCVREIDTVARLGGDEFTIVLGNLDDQGDVRRICQKILKSLSYPYHFGNEIAYISASLGVTFFPKDADSVEELLRNADQAMYAAKNLGRNRFVFFTSDLRQEALIRHRLANDLRSESKNTPFRLLYQPIVDLHSGEIRKAEALVRWNHPTQGIISPFDFVKIAEETGLIVEIGNWVFEEAAKQAVKWRQRFSPDFQISINTSPVQYLREQQNFNNWITYLKKLKLPGSAIAVEITESLLMESHPSVVLKLLGLRNLGIRISIDDFGTGYSSLSYLKKFHSDYLKIDQTFIRNLKPDSDELALCEAMIVMGHKLNIKVIAEGIESDEQRRLLINAGCDYGQGYLFSKPRTAMKFENLLEQREAEAV